MITGADVAAEARRWVGTPFHHQGHRRGVGCDCAGLVGGVAVALGLMPADFWQRAAAPFAGYSKQPHDGHLERACDAFMERIDIPKIGDVLGIRFAEEPQHLAILVDHPQGLGIVHAVQSSFCVVEHRFADVWRARVVQAWRLPGIV